MSSLNFQYSEHKINKSLKYFRTQILAFKKCFLSYHRNHTLLFVPVPMNGEDENFSESLEKRRHFRAEECQECQTTKKKKAKKVEEKL